MLHKLLVCLVAVASMVAVSSQADAWAAYEDFPAGLEWKGRTGLALPNGRLVVWNGSDLFMQDAPHIDSFTMIASGYDGDPGFLALKSDGHTLIMGGGFNGRIYEVDVNAPTDYQSGDELYTFQHYSGVLLSDDLLLIDRQVAPAPSELVVYNLTDGTVKAIMEKPSAAQVPAGESAASAGLTIDAAKSTVYAQAYVLDDSTWALTNKQLRGIAVADILAAYDNGSATPSALTWENDATAIGGPLDFNGGGPAYVTSYGTLLIGGWSTAGVQEIDPAAAPGNEVIATYSPEDAAGAWGYFVIYNSVNDDIIVVTSDGAWLNDSAIPQLPAVGGIGLILLAGALSLGARRRGA